MDSSSSHFPVSLQQLHHQQQFNERILEHLAFDSDVFERWRLIGTAQGLATDIEIASFLIQHYEHTWDKAEPVVYCVTCHNPLTLTCTKCSTPNALDATQNNLPAASSGTFNTQQTPSTKLTSAKRRIKSEKRKAKSAKVWAGSNDNDEDLMGLYIQFAQTEGKSELTALPSQSSKRGVKSYVCGLCGKFFFKSSDLKKHTRIHTHEKPYACQICPAAFSDPSSFSRHKRVHTGEKPFPCTECQSAFAQSSDLTKHMRIHTRDRPLKCQHCDAAFSDPSTFARHRRKHLRHSAK